MKRLVILSIACLMVVFVGKSVWANGDCSYYSTFRDDFTTKFWTEKFFGGDHGEPGNVLMAVGEGFVFQNAVLTEEPVVVEHPESPSGYAWETTYTGGMVTFNKKGPWGENYKLRDVTATNISWRDEQGYPHFRLRITHYDDESELTFHIYVTFDADSENYKIQENGSGDPVFQTGYGFGATIYICDF